MPPAYLLLPLLLAPAWSIPLEGEAPRGEPRPQLLSASMQCDRAPEPGRVRCTIEAEVSQPLRIRWSEAEIVTVPEFTTPLRARLGRADIISEEPGRIRFAFALAAKALGRGPLRARVRAVVCEGELRCHPEERTAESTVVVGPAEP